MKKEFLFSVTLWTAISVHHHQQVTAVKKINRGDDLCPSATVSQTQSLLVVPAGPGLPEPDETAGPFAFRTGNPGVRHAAQSYRPISTATAGKGCGVRRASAQPSS